MQTAFNVDAMVAAVRLQKSLREPFRGATVNEVQRGDGRIARAYKAAAALDAALGIPPTKGATVTRMYP